MTTARRRFRLLVAIVGLVALSGCSGDPGVCAQLGSLGLCG